MTKATSTRRSTFPTGGVDKEHTFKILTLEELSQLPEPDFIVENFLSEASTSVVTGKQASGKSGLLLDMSLCVASGIDWQGYKVKQGPVIYVCAEGVSGIQRRVAAWVEHFGRPGPRDFYVISHSVQIADKEIQRAFVDKICHLSPVLVVLDTLARCAVGLDENSSRDMTMFADAMTAIAAETKAHVLAVHHNSKAGEYRGSTAIPASVDAHLTVERNDSLITLASIKTKDWAEESPLQFEMVTVALPQSSSKAKSSFVLRRTQQKPPVRTSAEEAKVFNAIVGFGSAGASSGEWQKSAIANGVSEATFHRYKNSLLNKGLVALIAGAKGKRSAIYASSKTKDAESNDLSETVMRVSDSVDNDNL